MNSYSRNLKDGNKNRSFIDTFGGFNHNLRIGENEFYDCLNISSHNYPLMESRGYSASWSRGHDGIVGITYNEGLYEALEINGKLALKTYIGAGSITYEIGRIATENVGKERQLINFGAYIIVMPDKLYLNTADTDDKGSIEKVFRNIDEAEHYNRWYVVKPCDIDGNEFEADSYSATEPSTTDLPDGYTWYDLNDKVIKQWSNSYSMWTTPTIYHKYRIQGIGIFKEGDGVKVKHYVKGNEAYSATTTIIKAYSNGEVPISETPPMNADYIVIPSADDMKIHWNIYSETGSLYNKWRSLLSVEQKMPKMDYLFECQGRLWGCRYGDTQTDEIRQYRTQKYFDTSQPQTSWLVQINTADNGETIGDILTYWLYDDDYNRITSGASVSIYQQTTDYIIISVTATDFVGNINLNVNYTVLKTQKLNEIYSSKQQDFKCWDYFQGTALDSYTASIGASGKWTGCINYNGKPLFSKEDRMIIVYGNYPAQYQTQENVFEGVGDGYWKSMVVYNGVLFYKGNHGIYMYNGGYPQKISQALGDIKFTANYTHNNATTNVVCASAFDGYYVIFLYNSDFEGFYEYDIEKGIWTRSIVKPNGNTVRPIQMVSSPKELYYMGFSTQVSNNMYTGKLEDDSVAEENRNFGDWYAETGLFGLNTPDMKYITKITMRYKGYAKVKIKYDSDASWTEEYTLSGGLTSKTFTLIPKRCDHFQLRFEGTEESPMFKLYSISKTIENGSDVTNGNI